MLQVSTRNMIPLKPPHNIPKVRKMVRPTDEDRENLKKYLDSARSQEAQLDGQIKVTFTNKHGDKGCEILSDPGKIASTRRRLERRGATKILFLKRVKTEEGHIQTFRHLKQYS